MSAEPAHFDVLGIGNAVVDVVTKAEDDFITAHGLKKGTMMLVDEQQAEALYAQLGPGVESSGGSAANTIAALSSMGGKGAFIGKVRDDQLGKVFAHDMRALGAHFDTSPANSGAATATCLILVTPDAQRTMQTHLGISAELSPEDIDHDVVARAKVTYLEGYLWDPPRAKEAFIEAAKTAHRAGRKVSLTLSDPFCVDRHREDFLDLVNRHVDVLFANEEEIKSLYQVEDFDAALQQVRGHCEIAALTRSEKGSVVLSGDEVHVVDAEKVDIVVDTTGAGDAYAAGFLYGFTHGKDLRTCGRLASIAAAEVISHYGARPETDLKSLISATTL